MNRTAVTKVQRALVAGSALLLLAGCHQDMWNQPKAKAQSKSDLIFADGSNTRGTIPGTVAFGEAKLDREFYTGLDKDNHLIKEFPVAVDEALLKRGQERFRIFCTPCHGEQGNGKGFIASRGFTQARPVGNYHTDRLRNMPVGHFFDVITNGYGTMYPYRARITPMDRWAIVAYIRVLQEAHYSDIGTIPASERTRLEGMKADPGQDSPPELPIGAPPDRMLNSPGGAVREVPLGRRAGPGQVVPSAPVPAGRGTVQPVQGGIER
ncbi:MAG: cytochrome c [Armatimonadetes bacterium]|nr:cytochrome c [Armatimonadota bacterium]